MAYPNADQIQGFVNAYHSDPLSVYAFSAQHGRIPNDGSEMAGFLAAVKAEAARLGTGTEFVLGFVQDRGGTPNSWDAWVNWQVDNGILTKDKSDALVPTGKYPWAGMNYPPGGAPVNPTLAPAPPVLTPAPPGTITTVSPGTTPGAVLDFNWSSIRSYIFAHPLQSALVAGVGYLYFFGMPKGHRRR